MSNEIPWLNSAELIEEREEVPTAADSLIPVEIEVADDAADSAAPRYQVPKRSYAVPLLVLAATSAAFALGAAYARQGQTFEAPRPQRVLSTSASRPIEATPALPLAAPTQAAPAQPPVSVHVEPAQPVRAEVPAATPTAPAVAARGAASRGDSLRAAFVSLNRGDALGAVTRAKAVLRASPHRADAWLVLGSAYDALHDAGSAQAAFRECLEHGRGAAVKTCALLAHD